MNRLTVPWRQGLTLERANQIANGTMVETLGIVITEFGHDFLRGEMTVSERSCQPMGILHGGASVAFAETLASVAATAAVKENEFALGQEINANHLRPVPKGDKIFGETYAVHLGSRSHVWCIDIRNAAGDAVCISRITMAVVARR